MTEIPRDSEGRRLCQFCLDTPVPASLGTKPRSYCSRSCRQRAYEARRLLDVVKEAFADGQRTARDAAAAAAATSHDVPASGTPVDPATSHDVPKSAGQPPATSGDVPPARRGRPMFMPATLWDAAEGEKAGGE